VTEPQLAPFDPPTRKTLPRTKHEVDRITHCRDRLCPFEIRHRAYYWVFIWDPPFWGKGRS